MADLILTVGQSRRLSVAGVTATDNLTPPPQPITWSTNEPTWLTLTDFASDNSSVTANATVVGTVTITVVVGVYTKTFDVEIEAAPDLSVTGIVITKETPQRIPIKEIQRLFFINVTDALGGGEAKTRSVNYHILAAEQLGMSQVFSRLTTAHISISSLLGTNTGGIAHIAGNSFMVVLGDNLAGSTLATRIASANRLITDNMGFITTAMAVLASNNSFLLLEDGVSRLLQEDGTSKFILEP